MEAPLTPSEWKVKYFPYSNKNECAKFFINHPVPKILGNLWLTCHLEDKFAHRSRLSECLSATVSVISHALLVLKASTSVTLK